MDSIISSVLEEICFHGQGGSSLSSLCSKLDIPSPLKSSLWKNLLSIPTLRFKTRNAEFLSPNDASIQCAEDAEKIGIKILANEKLRNNFVGLYDENIQISSQQRRTLERLAIARTNGVTQSQLAKEFGIEGNKFFYILENLKCRGLIVKQSAHVRKKEPCTEGESKNSSPVTTNLIYLYRYAKLLSSQQRFEIYKEEQAVESLGYDDENVPDDDGFALENVKEIVRVNDYLPAMKAVCDKLEEANGKVLVVSDIKQDLGYTRSSGHKAWRNIYRRLKDAGLVEDSHAVVKKVGLCLKLVKRFSEKNFDPNLLGCDDLDKRQQLKFGRTIPNVDQIVELPIDNQIYDMVDAEGSEGLLVITVCKRLGIDKNRNYSRFVNMFSRFGMHRQLESYEKTKAYRVWTSGNSNPKSCNAFLTKSKNADDENEISYVEVVNSEVPDGSNQNFLEHDPSTSAGSFSTLEKVNDMENDTKISCGYPGETNHSVVYSDNMQEFPTDRSNTALDAELDLVSRESEIHVPPPESTGLALLKPPDSGSCQTYSSQVLTADGTRREQRILERLQDEKFILRCELYRWLVEFEKEKSTKMDRKTVDRMLKKLQQQGHCKCMQINVPVVTNCWRSHIIQVVLHPSVESLHPELLSEIHDRLRSFEMQIHGRGSLKLKNNDSVPVLDGVQRTQSHVVSDAKAAKSKAMRANGFVLAKMVRSKLLHGFLWGFLSSSHGWNDALSLEKNLHDQKNLHGSCVLFSLEAAIKAIPLELFLQVVGATLEFDDMIEKCRKGFSLADLPIQEYKLLMDTQATRRLSLLIDILRRLKLIQLVPDECSDNRIKVPHANLTHAMELKPYIEEPLSLVATSTFRSLDLRPRIRHDFILSNREAVDDYWKTLEYCYAAADPRAALHAFPGSSVHEVFLNRSWASVRGTTADQCAELLKRIANDNLNEKLSYKDCENIAKDLNLTLEQVLCVYYDKHQKRLNRFRGIPNSNEEHQLERNKQSSARKRKRSSNVKSVESTRVDARTIQLDEQEVATLPEWSKGVGSVSAEWSNINMNSEDYQDLQGPAMVSPTAQDEDLGRLGAGQCKGSIQSSRYHRFHQKLVKLWNIGNGVGRQVHKSLAISNAVELFNLVFLSTSTAPPFPNLLAETLRRYSEHDLFAAFSYLRDRKIMRGSTCSQPFVPSQQFLHSISKSPFPHNTGKRAANFSAWIHEREKDLMEGGINLTADLQCGDIFHLFSLVSSGELSVSPCLPDEGVGEAEDLRSLKRRAEDNEVCDADKAKKLKSIAEGEFVSRREKGFPGIMVSVYSTTFSTANTSELFKDDETCTPELVNDETLSKKVNSSSTNSDHMKEMLKFANNVTIASTSSESPWEAMASYTEHLLSKPSDEGQGSHFDPEINKVVCAEIQKAGHQGLSIEDVHSLVNMPGEQTPEIIIDTLQAFGRALKLNACDSVRVVDALHHSKYFLSSISCFHQDLKPPLSLMSQEKDDGNFILRQENQSLDTANLSGSVTVGDVHKVTILNLSEEHALPTNKIPTSNVNGSCMAGKVGSSEGDNEGEIYKPSSGERLVPILPWINADGTINRLVYNGLIRRVLGTVMQNPGILEEGIICQMDVLNPQSCRKLLELMILDRHLIVKKMLQTTGRGPPALLATLLGSSGRKSKMVCRKHFFTNPTSTFLL